MILQQGADICPHSHCIKDEITTRDRDLLLTQHEPRADMYIVVEVERAIGWPRLWDLTLDMLPNVLKALGIWYK